MIGAVKRWAWLELGLRNGIWAPIAALNDDMTTVGFLVIGIFLLVWGASAAVYRWKGGDALPLPRLALPEAAEREG